MMCNDSQGEVYGTGYDGTEGEDRTRVCEVVQSTALTLHRSHAWPVLEEPDSFFLTDEE
jgi:hypothetical protein